jgi:predicted alpha/beta hydrolase family esterase
MTKRFVAVPVVLLLLASLAGCSAKYGMPIDSTEVDGIGTLGISVTGQQIKGLVIYFHGSDQDAHVIEDDRKHTDLFDPALRAGYAVVAANAQGNAFGNPASLEDYRRLIAAAQRKYIAGPIFFVAESMGAIAALSLIKEDMGRQVKGMVGVSPLMGLPDEVRQVNFVAGPWAGHVPETADPLTWAPHLFEGRNFLLYASSEDKVVPANASAQAFADKFGSVAKIKIVDCAGGHVASACYQGVEVYEWMTGLR